MNEHHPVLLTEVITGLAIKPNGVYLDLTIGRGGHAREILKSLTSGRLLGFDQDATAIASLSALKTSYPALTLYHQNFRDFPIMLAQEKIHRVDGILLDLGVSSPQFDVAERGFSYRFDGPLDMRMDQRQGKTATMILATEDVKTLTRIFRDYADETFAYPIAKAIIKQRQIAPITSTSQLVNLIKAVKPAKALMKKGHPAKQVFQALRIAVNDELNVLKDTIEKASQSLTINGRLAVISFHSGEDRIVKQYFQQLTVIEGSRRGPAMYERPSTPSFLKQAPYPCLPSPEEVAMNHRAESAVLRIIERIKDEE
jgi:16S rRNA (cytosine1402-N4)-methyltransferase